MSYFIFKTFQLLFIFQLNILKFFFNCFWNISTRRGFRTNFENLLFKNLHFIFLSLTIRKQLDNFLQHFFLGQANLIYHIIIYTLPLLIIFRWVVKPMKVKCFFITLLSPEEHVFIFQNKQIHLAVIFRWYIGHDFSVCIHHYWNQKIHHNQWYYELWEHK
jgi:hypothetical protein